MNKPTTPKEAREQGFEIDSHVYPWVAYKGPRFTPTEWHLILTDKEALGVENLEKALGMFKKIKRMVDDIKEVL